ncbi:MAG: hypothetical protein GXX08_02235 [Firmicutes bacterium]|mgnify:CR=1 FL=1|nr:hypothetical protein [Bacillota bacterium]
MPVVEYRWRFDTGVVDDDHVEGLLDDFHVDVFNRSTEPITVEVTVYKLIHDQPASVIQTLTKTILPDSNNWFTIDVPEQINENFLVVLKHNGDDKDDLLATVYGRDKNEKAISSATYRHTELLKTELLIA